MWLRPFQSRDAGRLCSEIRFSLSQSCPALLANSSVQIIAEIFFARRACPVISGKIDKGENDKDLTNDDVLFRQLSENLRSLVHEGEQEKKCYRRDNGEDLAFSFNSVIPYVFLLVVWIHRHYVTLEQNHKQIINFSRKNKELAKKIIIRV